jgi:hypothetical protein
MSLGRTDWARGADHRRHHPNDHRRPVARERRDTGLIVAIRIALSFSLTSRSTGSAGPLARRSHRPRDQHALAPMTDSPP